MEIKEVSDWLKLPVQLQHQFFQHASEEAERCKKRLLERMKRINELKRYIRTEPIPDSDDWKDLRVAVIDGSNSPSTSERLGSRFGTYCAGYMIFEGRDFVEEGYRAGRFTYDQIGSQDVTQKILHMFRCKLEREVALHCLEEKNADYILIDGSFYGFRIEACLINNEPLNAYGYSIGMDLTEDVRDLTWDLLKSRKVVGIIKRTRTNALDGWLVYLHGNEDHCIDANDKYIMSLILPIQHWFSYKWLFGSAISFNFYSRFRNLYRRIVLHEKKNVTMDEIYEASRGNLSQEIKESLGMNVDEFLQTARYYIRCCNASPFEFETHKDMDVRLILSYFKNFHNPATGLPWPLDLIDENITLPRGFNKEFVEEIEARLIRDPEVSNKLALQEYFSYLNPQKAED
ncbi:MAG: DNA double-strand break repair nuclease NurA [Nitrososphaerales archaeon]